MSSPPAPSRLDPESQELSCPEFFRCDGCLMPFESLFEGSNQALGCSTESSGREASSHYGSSFDMERFARPFESLRAPPMGDLCDACLFCALADGSLAHIAPESGPSALMSPEERQSAIEDYRAWLIRYSRQLADFKQSAGGEA